MPSKPKPRKCRHIKDDGTKCNAWAVRTSNPPRCAAHGGGKAPVGPPKHNKNARTHGAHARLDDVPPVENLTIEDIIIDLATRQRQLSQYIDTHTHRDDFYVEDLARLLALHGQNASRLGRLLRDKRALSGDAADGLTGAIAQALDELSTELGVQL